jgi:hypothetical protein
MDPGPKIIGGALIKNPYRSTGKVARLEKAQAMALALERELVRLNKVELAIIEASTGSHGGRCNVNTMCRLAIISGVAYGACNAAEKIFVPPPTWKKVQDKYKNHDLYLEPLTKAQRRSLEIKLARVPKSKQHNLIDAYCMALWGQEIYINEDINN